MALSIAFELSDQDLEYFVAAQRKAAEAVTNKTEDEIIAAGVELLEEAQRVKVPDFIADRLAQLDTMIAMVRDEGWDLPAEDRQRVLAALAYFVDPADLIPDAVPVLGFLDDAIMIELCVRDLKHELDAYNDFCDYREMECGLRGLDPASIGCAEWLDARRQELHNRMHNRRSRDIGMGYGSSSGYGAGKRSYLSGSWRPGIFRVR